MSGVRLDAQGTRSRKAANLLRGMVGVIAVLAVWQLLASLRLVQPEYFPTATTVLRVAASLVVQPAFLGQLLGTLGAMLLGLIIATVVAVPIGIVLGRFAVLYRMTSLLVEAMRPIPALALVPVAILLFGLSNATTVSLVVWTSIWPILINSVYGMHSVDPVALETGRAFGFGRWTTLTRIALPAAAPFIVTGIRIAVGIALAVAVAVEMVTGSGTGIGGWIVEASSGGSMVGVYAAAVLVGLVGYAVNAVFERLERRFFAWHASFRGEGS